MVGYWKYVKNNILHTKIKIKIKVICYIPIFISNMNVTNYIHFFLQKGVQEGPINTNQSKEHNPLQDVEHVE